MNISSRRCFVILFVSFGLLIPALLTAFAGTARGQGCALNSSIYAKTTQPYSFVAIHLEHYNTPIEHENPFDALAALVDDADALQIPLTIMFHQSWIDWLMDTGEHGGAEHDDTVRGWFDPNRPEGPVHEPGIHNHGPAHMAQPQSGYTEWPVVSSRAQDLNDHFVASIRDCESSPPHQSCYDYLADPIMSYPNPPEGTQGTIRTVKDEIEAFLNDNQFGATFDIVSGTVMVPWHEAAETYAVSQRRNNTPSTTTEDSGRNHRIPKVTAFNGDGPHDQYLLIGEAFPLGDVCEEEIEPLWNNDFGGLEPENIYGVVFHAKDYNVLSGNRARINSWLEALNAIDDGNSEDKRKTMRAIMESVVVPTDYWYAGFPGDGFCDALEACGDTPEDPCTTQQIGSANPYDNDLDGDPTTFTNWGLATHNSPLDCGGPTDEEGDNLNASATGRGSTLRHSGRAYQAESDAPFVIQHGEITFPSDAQGGAAVRLDSQTGNEVVVYDLIGEDFTGTNDTNGSFPITHWEVSIRSRKLNSFGVPPEPEVTISTRESNSGTWDVKCLDVKLSNSATTWQESAGCSVSWSASATNRQLRIERDYLGAHIDALLLRPDWQQCPPPQTGC